MNSWGKSDSFSVQVTNDFILGEKDYKLAMKLADAGAEHGKWLRQVQVWVDITAPRFW